MWQTWCHERLQHQAMTRAQGTRKINDPRFIRDAPNDTPQLRIVFDWVYNTKPWPGWRSPTSLFAGEKFLRLCERLRDLFHNQIRKVLFYDFVLPRKFRSQTSDLWTDAATALTRTREEKESEERERKRERKRESVETRLKVKRRVRSHLAGRKKNRTPHEADLEGKRLPKKCTWLRREARVEAKNTLE